MVEITLDDYFGNFRTTHALEFNPEIEHNALITIGVVNAIIKEAVEQGAPVRNDPFNRPVRSGWRPPSYNANVPRASRTSHHMTGKALDRADPLHGLAEWLFDEWKRNGDKCILAKYGAWCEHPDSTPTWVHFQTVPPGSGNRWFRP